MSAIDVRHLDFLHPRSEAPALADVSIHLPRGSRAILLGANGAGKSTLLQILAGKRLTNSHATVLGASVFFSTPKGVTYLGTEWASNPVVRSDIAVADFLDSIGGYRYKERRDKLLELLDVDINWHMHKISDGERRRVQIVQGLMAPWELLLLDEVTVDLDVLVRAELLNYLTEETKSRNATILYATHIFDGLDDFATHICHLQLGSTLEPSLVDWTVIISSTASREEKSQHLSQHVLEELDKPKLIGSKLLVVALAWLREDREARRRLEEKGEFNRRGPAAASDVPTDSESFYRKYDYGS